MKTINHDVQYLIFIFLSRLFSLFPVTWATWSGKTLGALFYKLDQRHRKVALDNLNATYGSKLSAIEIEQIAKASFKHLGISVIEMFRLKMANKNQFLNKVSIEGMEHYQEAIKKGKGLVFIGAHFGNWELLAIVISLLFQKGFIIARKLDNPRIHKKIEELRTFTGNRIIDKNDAFWEMIKLLKNGELVGVLMDQNVDRKEGVFVPFLGRPACTNKGLALVLLKTKTPMVPIFMVRNPNGTFKVIVKPEIPLIQTGKLKNDVLQNTAQITLAIEEIVRQYPEQWLWMHRRWKTQIEPSGQSIRNEPGYGEAVPFANR
jgi:Kdo2-lipid IVA lauroyltransferase/acyltransferase